MSASASTLDHDSLRDRLSGEEWIERLVLLDSVDSTNDELRRLAKAGAAAGTLVLAAHQASGN